MIQLVFDKFSELGSTYAVFRYLAVNDLQLGFRRHRGGRIGELEWKPVSPQRILSILRHPIYAGAYAYGLHRAGIRNPATGRTEGGQWFVPPEELPVLIHGRLPAYISWDQFLKNQEQLKQNRSLHHTRGAPKRGEALTGTKFSVCAAAFLPRKNASTAACPPNSSTTGPKNIAVAHSAAIRTGVSWLSNQW